LDLTALDTPAGFFLAGDTAAQAQSVMARNRNALREPAECARLYGVRCKPGC